MHVFILNPFAHVFLNKIWPGKNCKGSIYLEIDFVTILFTPVLLVGFVGSLQPI